MNSSEFKIANVPDDLMPALLNWVQESQQGRVSQVNDSLLTEATGLRRIFELAAAELERSLNE